jgi:hypothetical protein
MPLLLYVSRLVRTADQREATNGGVGCGTWPVQELSMRVQQADVPTWRGPRVAVTTWPSGRSGRESNGHGPRLRTRSGMKRSPVSAFVGSSRAGELIGGWARPCRRAAGDSHGDDAPSKASTAARSCLSVTNQAGLLLRVVGSMSICVGFSAITTGSPYNTRSPHRSRFVRP